MAVDIDEKYFQELNQLDPTVVCRRALCEYNKEKKCYVIEIINELYEVFPESKKINSINSEEEVTKNTALFILFYLIHIKDIPITKSWISEKDLPGGVQFFTGPHAIPVNLITGKYENNTDLLIERCSQLNGEELEMADCSFAFRAARRFPIALLYWKGDEEFSSDAKILFDSSLKNQFPLDIIFVIAAEFCRKIIQYQ